MIIPCHESAVVPDAKVRDYLLSPTHPIGRHKARWFERLGYDQGRFHELANDLRALASRDADTLGDEGYGEKYAVVGSIVSPSGEQYTVRTAWIFLHGRDRPSLVTAYPGN